MKQVKESWLGKDAVFIAKNLLGKVIEHDGMSGMIVETEAYKKDGASHGYTITDRSRIMLDSHGRWYVYFIYGMYHCLNITTNKGDVGAVLIRALEPLEGIEKMKSNRRTDNVKNLCSGPGKVCQAMGISKDHNNSSLHSPIQLLHKAKIPEKLIVSSRRIGISKDEHLPWRFYIKDNPYVSRR